MEKKIRQTIDKKIILPVLLLSKRSPIPDLPEKKKNRKRCCAITNVFFPLVKLPCHEDKDADVDNTWLRARQQMWCNYGMMYQALKLPHHLHDYRSDRVRKRSGLTKKYPRLSCERKKRKRKEKKGRRRGEKRRVGYERW